MSKNNDEIDMLVQTNRWYYHDKKFYKGTVIRQWESEEPNNEYANGDMGYKFYPEGSDAYLVHSFETFFDENNTAENPTDLMNKLTNYNNDRMADMDKQIEQLADKNYEILQAYKEFADGK